MTEADQDSILSLVAAEITPEEFLKRFNAARTDVPALVTRLINESMEAADADGLECALLVGFMFEFVEQHIPILCELLEYPWHHSHEDLVMALDRFHSPLATDSLYRATLARHEYLAFDDAHALAVKALYALSNINNASAQEMLRLASHSEIPRIADEATERLNELETGSL